MSTYVMSDLHGCYDSFMQMLKEINFNDEDKLYILGDIFDRGKNPILIFDYILNHKNIELIMGNHEKMFLEWWEGERPEYPMLYGYNTIKEIQEMQIKVQFNYCEELYKQIKKLPLYKIIEVNEQKYILTHARIVVSDDCKDKDIDEFINLQEENTLLWNGDTSNEKQYKDYINIVGHTPTPLIREDKQSLICNKGCVIYIDCGACFNGGRLGCLRLDGMKEFYI